MSIPDFPRTDLGTVRLAFSLGVLRVELNREESLANLILATASTRLSELFAEGALGSSDVKFNPSDVIISTVQTYGY